MTPTGFFQSALSNKVHAVLLRWMRSLFRPFPICSANTRVSANILILSEGNLQKLMSVSLTAPGKTPFDVKWLWDMPNKAKNTRPEVWAPLHLQGAWSRWRAAAMQQLPCFNRSLWEVTVGLNTQTGHGPEAGTAQHTSTMEGTDPRSAGPEGNSSNTIHAPHTLQHD